MSGICPLNIRSLLVTSGKSIWTFWTCPKPRTEGAGMTTLFEVCYVFILSIIHPLSILYSSVCYPVKGGAVCTLWMCPSVWIWQSRYLSLSFQFMSTICPLSICYSFLTRPWCSIAALLQSDTSHLIWPPDINGLDYFVSGAFRYQFRWDVTQP